MKLVHDNLERNVRYNVNKRSLGVFNFPDRQKLYRNIPEIVNGRMRIIEFRCLIVVHEVPTIKQLQEAFELL